MMRDVTDLMDRYRVVARSVWNTGFWCLPEMRTWDAKDQFEQIKTLLFKSLVAARLEVGHCCDLYSLPDQVYRVVPNGPEPVPAMISRPREGDRNSYWDDPIREMRASEVELEFLDYFDWNAMALADFQYYRVRIAAFTSQPLLVGREALMEHGHARVFVIQS